MHETVNISTSEVPRTALKSDVTIVFLFLKKTFHVAKVLSEELSELANIIKP